MAADAMAADAMAGNWYNEPVQCENQTVKLIWLSLGSVNSWTSGIPIFPFVPLHCGRMNWPGISQINSTSQQLQKWSKEEQTGRISGIGLLVTHKCYNGQCYTAKM